MKSNNRYAAVDFETLDTWRATICQLSCVIFEDGKIVEEYETYICPPSKNENKYCLDTHGIRYKDVENAPTFDEIWPKVHEMIGDSPVISHNAPFERSCLKACNEEFGTPCDYKFIDTLTLSRKLLKKLYNHKLDTVCRYLGVRLKRHHDALEDARACGQVYLKLKERFLLTD